MKKNAFLFHTLSLACKVKYQRRTYLCPWVISEFTYFPQNIVFKSNLKAYYKVRQFVITKCDSLLLQSVTAILLQSATSVITKCDRYYKVRQFYYKVRQVLQSAMIITKCDRTDTKQR